MPLTKRSVSPVGVSVNRIPGSVRSGELECVSNGALANLIRQLSSLSRHAEDLIGELYHEAVKVQHKTNTLAQRVDRLQLKVTQLDSNVEEVSLKDLHLRKAFKSSSLIDQHTLSRQTLPTALGEAYMRCDAPPELNKLNPYRDPGTEPALKLYTDPDYFFRLWREEMLKDGESARKSRHPGKDGVAAAQPAVKAKRAKHQRPGHPSKNRGEDFVREMGQYQAPVLQQGGAYPYHQPPPGMVRPDSNPGSSGYGSAAFPSAHSNGTLPQGAHVHLQSERTAHYAPQHHADPHYQAQAYGRAVTSQYMAPHPATLRRDETPTPTQDPMSPGGSQHSDSSRRPSQPPPAPPPPPAFHNGGQQHLGARLGQMGLNGDDSRAQSPDLPPPPPPLTMDGAKTPLQSDYPNPIPPIETGNQGGPPPPPPPPPPPGLAMNGGSSLKEEIAKRAAERAANGGSFGGVAAPAPKAAASDNSELLRAIREGVMLKKVERQAEKAQEKEALAKGDDVAAILRKRMEDVMGTSDSDEPDDFNEDDEWDE